MGFEPMSPKRLMPFYLLIKSQPAFASIHTFQRPFPTPSNPKPTSAKTVSHFPPFDKNHRRGFWTKDFERRSVSDLKGWGKRLEMAAEMCELMQKRVDF